MFPQDFHYPPIDTTKTRTFYEFILVDTDSVEISHTQDNNGHIMYSKIKIIQVITPQEWNKPLHGKKSFSRSFNPQHYSYYDYIDAWSHILYFIPKKHSWFIWFKKGIPLKFPKWFIKWFVDFGPLPSIFPAEIKEVYTYFREHSTFVPGYRLISFVASQCITWIVAWDYAITQPYEGVEIKSLSRRIRIKWWRKFNTKLVQKEKIKEWLQITQAQTEEHPQRINEESLFLSEKQRVMAALASASLKEEFERTLKIQPPYMDPMKTVQKQNHHHLVRILIWMTCKKKSHKA